MESLHVTDFESPIGRLRIASTVTGLAYVELPRASGRGFEGWLRRHAKGARRVHDAPGNRAALDQILEYLDGQRTAFDLKLDVRATPFERSVYAELARIPYGETCSYAAVARAIGRERAVRAVGAANAANPLSLVLPCHRVIRSGGALGGYGGGLELKARLLAMERARATRGRLL